MPKAGASTKASGANGKRQSRLPDLLDDPRVQREIEDFERFLERKHARQAQS